MKIETRAARLSDYDALDRLQNDAFPGDALLLSLADMKSHLAGDTPGAILVATEGERVVGYAVLTDRPKRPWTGCDFIAVAPTHAHRGIGARLLEEIFRGARRPLLRGHVRASNTTARRLYRRHGFVSTGRKRSFYLNGDDAIAILAQRVFPVMPSLRSGWNAPPADPWRSQAINRTVRFRLGREEPGSTIRPRPPRRDGCTAMKIETRAARLSDYDALDRLQNDAFPGDALLLSLADMKSRLAGDTPGAILVATEGERVVGYTVMTDRPKRPWTGWDFLAIDLARARRGVGARLVEEVLRRARRPLIRGHVRASNIAALRLYQKHGFISTGRKRSFYSNGDDAIALLGQRVFPVMPRRRGVRPVAPAAG